MILIISDKKKQFEISQIDNIHNDINEYYIREVFDY